MKTSILRTAPLPLGFATAAFFLFLLPGMLGPYGPFIDELYYVSCAQRPAWGYVDHPPLAMLFLSLARLLLGHGMLALRLPAALAGALAVLSVGLLARRLGAGRFAQALACGAMLASPVNQVLFGTYSMNAFEILFWLVSGWILVEIEMRRDERLWLLFGAVAGLGLLNKHTMVLFALALGVGLAATPARRSLFRPWLWLGAAVAALLFAPNVLWQASHHWPSLEFYRNAHMEKNVSTSASTVLLLQVLFMNPGTLPLWVAGIAALLHKPFLPRRQAQSFDLRHLGVLALTLLAILVAGGEKRPDRIAGMYPLLFVTGGIAWEAMLSRRRSLRWALSLWLVAWGLLLMPLGTPILGPPRVVVYARALRFQVQMERGAGKRTPLPQWLADRLGWEQLVEDVAAAREKLRSDERQRVVFFAPSYGQAGALDWLGADRGLCPVFCTHNSWFLWGPPRDPISVAIVLGNDPQSLGELFEEVELAGIHDCEFCMPWRDQMPIWIVRRPRELIAAHWEEWKHFE